MHKITIALAGGAGDGPGGRRGARPPRAHRGSRGRARSRTRGGRGARDRARRRGPGRRARTSAGPSRPAPRLTVVEACSEQPLLADKPWVHPLLGRLVPLGRVVFVQAFGDVDLNHLPRRVGHVAVAVIHVKIARPPLICALVDVHAARRRQREEQRRKRHGAAAVASTLFSRRGGLFEAPPLFVPPRRAL